MSRIGKMPVTIPVDVKVDLSDSVLILKNQKGELTYRYTPEVKIEYKDNQITVTRKTDELKARQRHGLTRTLINNMMIGLTKGYKRDLEINGVGYKVESKGKKIILNLGYSHPIYFYPPEGIAVNVAAPTKFSVEGIDKELVGQVAAKLRSFRPPEPYKGKGIKYANEYIVRKTGKA